MSEREILRQYFTTDITAVETEKKHKLSLKTLRRRYTIVLHYNERDFLDKVLDDYRNMSNAGFRTKHRITSTAYVGFEQGYKFGLKPFIKWLTRLGVHYDLEILKERDDDPEDNIMVKLGGKVEKKPSVFTLTSVEKAELKKNLEILDSQRKFMLDMLRERQVSEEFVTKIDKRLSVLLRTTLAVGIETQRGGYGDRALRLLFKKEGIV